MLKKTYIPRYNAKITCIPPSAKPLGLNTCTQYVGCKVTCYETYLLVAIFVQLRLILGQMLFDSRVYMVNHVHSSFALTNIKSSV